MRLGLGCGLGLTLSLSLSLSLSLTLTLPLPLPVPVPVPLTRAMQFVTKARLAKQPLFLWMAPTLPHAPDRFRQYLAEWPTPCMDGEPNPNPDPDPDPNP